MSTTREVDNCMVANFHTRLFLIPLSGWKDPASVTIDMCMRRNDPETREAHAVEVECSVSGQKLTPLTVSDL